MLRRENYRPGIIRIVADHLRRLAGRIDPNGHTRNFELAVVIKLAPIGLPVHVPFQAVVRLKIPAGETAHVLPHGLGRRVHNLRFYGGPRFGALGPNRGEDCGDAGPCAQSADGELKWPDHVRLTPRLNAARRPGRDTPNIVPNGMCMQLSPATTIEKTLWRRARRESPARTLITAETANHNAKTA